MEVDSAVIVPPPLSLSSHAREQFTDIATKLDLQLNLTDSPLVDEERNPPPGGGEDEIEEEEEEEEGEGEEEEDGDSEFSFACADASSPISAEDLFDQGQIKPIFPWAENDAVTEPLKVGEESRLVSIPVKKVFVERSDLPAAYKSSEAEDIDRVAEGPYCAWSKRTESAGESTSSAPESCRKSNSTGFSKLRRFRHLLHRSQSDGKDTFVFLTPEKKTEKQEETTSSSASASASSSKKDKKMKGSSKGKKEDKAAAGETQTTSSRKSKTTKTTSSLASYALQYGGKGKEKEKRRSYLPYRQDLVGFFTNSNAMSKNIHPY